MGTVKPALTAEEWARPSAYRDAVGWDRYVERHANDPEKLVVGDTCLSGLSPGSYSFGPEIFHPLAALCLHEQPFGFTWEDVDHLRESIHEWDEQRRQRLEWVLRDLADRIEALLPPTP